MYSAFPFPPPVSTGSWHVTQSVWHNCVFPVRNSPKTSVMEHVSTPPPSSAFSSAHPVDKKRTLLRNSANSVADIKPVFATRIASVKILSAFCSEIPFISISFFRGVYEIASTVCRPASRSFFMSAALMPALSSFEIAIGSLRLSTGALSVFASELSCLFFAIVFTFVCFFTFAIQSQMHKNGKVSAQTFC